MVASFPALSRAATVEYIHAAFACLVTTKAAASHNTGKKGLTRLIQ